MTYTCLEFYQILRWSSGKSLLEAPNIKNPKLHQKKIFFKKTCSKFKLYLFSNKNYHFLLKTLDLRNHSIGWPVKFVIVSENKYIALLRPL